MTPKAERIRGRALQQARRRHFRANPLCVHCERKGYITLATQLDHITALVNGGADRSDNKQGLCDDCHKAKTNVDLGRKDRPSIGLDGWPIDDGMGRQNLAA